MQLAKDLKTQELHIQQTLRVAKAKVVFTFLHYLGEKLGFYLDLPLILKDNS